LAGWKTGSREIVGLKMAVFLEDLNPLTFNLSRAHLDLEERALRLRLDGGEPLELGAGGGQGQQAKQEDNRQPLHLFLKE
jgi:hypothetical protein